MPFDVSTLNDVQRPTGLWASSLVLALARDEAAGRRRPRLTEPNLDTWTRFHGRLSSVDFLSLLFEDAAVLHPIPFNPELLDSSLHPERLPEATAQAWLDALGSLALDTATAPYILEQAKRLGLPTRMARSDLHVVKAHHKVLELPGTGGQLAHHIVTTQTGLTLQDNFTIACGTWQELTLAGIVNLELGVPHSHIVMHATTTDLRSSDHPLRQRSFDFVLGLHPDKGGLFRIDDQLAIWFPSAKVLLV
ncbi:MAG TPA: hypothetical protein PLJ27_17255 [Polyangiaceae bacterium]|jgi:hypothetical protein|nr:hypothetical protein [Polyangiaceae bacterium]HOR38295.1 hypothetical protein [Polyangiaceae bacterium]HPK96225.1 hypothetical protein [Polyangiaceae bacterium]HQK19213.1 hypothetical protein [Polyangiaceae bacterium]HQM12775.1 hypothetical protein [Polyangiaceae bacterium]